MQAEAILPKERVVGRSIGRRWNLADVNIIKQNCEGVLILYSLGSSSLVYCWSSMSLRCS